MQVNVKKSKLRQYYKIYWKITIVFNQRQKKKRSKYLVQGPGVRKNPFGYRVEDHGSQNQLTTNKFNLKHKNLEFNTGLRNLTLTANKFVKTLNDFFSLFLTI